MTVESAAGKVRGCDENQLGPEMSRELFHPFLLGFSESCVPKKLGDWSWTNLNLVIGVIHLSNELKSYVTDLQFDDN